MRERIILMLYAVSAFIEDFAYYVLGKGNHRKDFSVETHWCVHNYCD